MQAPKRGILGPRKDEYMGLGKRNTWAFESEICRPPKEEYLSLGKRNTWGTEIGIPGPQK